MNPLHNSVVDKKGVSPLIATVLLIVFSVAITGVLVAWGGAYVSENTEKAKGTSQSTLDCATIGVDIVRAFANSSVATTTARNITRIDVQSIGQNAVNVKNVLISSATSNQCDFGSANGTIIQPATVVSFIGNCSVTCGTVDVIRVTTTCGGVKDILVGNTSVVGCQ